MGNIGMSASYLFFLGIFSWGASDVSSAADGRVEAVRAATRNIRETTRSWSGKGKGTVSQWRGAGVVSSLEAKFDLVFSGEKYRIKLDFLAVPGHPPMHRRIIVVCDGKALARAVFSDSIRPNGCRIEIFDANTAQGMVIAATDHAMYYPPQLLPLQFAHRRLLSGELACREMENGQCILRTPADSTFEYVVDPKQGWNVVKCRIRGTGEDGKEHEASTSGRWENQKGVWFLREFTEQSGEDARLGSRSVLRFDEFEVNPVVADEEFDWKRLGPCANGVIADRRTDILESAYQNIPPATEQEQRPQTVFERVEKLLPRSGVPPAR